MGSDIVGELEGCFGNSNVGHVRGGDHLYLQGCDVLGAVTSTGGKKVGTKKKPPVTKKDVKAGGKKLTASRLKGKSPHKAVMQSAARSSAKAANVGKKAVAKANAYNPAKHKPITVKGFTEIVGSGGFAVLGAMFSVLGANKPTSKKLTAKQQAALKAHTVAIAKIKPAADKAKKLGERALTMSKELDAARQKAAPILAKVMKPGTRLAGDDPDWLKEYWASPEMQDLQRRVQAQENVKDRERVISRMVDVNPDMMLGPTPEIVSGEVDFDVSEDYDSHFELMGAIREIVLGDDDPFDPFADPGDGSGGGYGGTDMSDLLLPPYDRSTDPDIIPMPTRGQPMTLAPGNNPPLPIYDMPPEDAIYYDWGKMPYNSTSEATGSAHYFAPRDDDRDGPFAGDGFLWNAATNQFDAIRAGVSNHDEHPRGQRAKKGNMNDPEGKGGDVAVNGQSMRNGWGQLMGNPSSKFAGLQMSGGGVWFSLPENAQTWMTADADRQLAILNDKIAATNKAAVDAWNASVMQSQREMEEAQRRQDAELALAQQAADKEAEIAMAKEGAQQAQLELEQQKLDLQAQKQLLDYYAQNPEASAAPPGYGDEGGGDGGGYLDPYAAEAAQAEQMFDQEEGGGGRGEGDLFNEEERRFSEADASEDPFSDE